MCRGRWPHPPPPRILLKYASATIPGISFLPPVPLPFLLPPCPSSPPPVLLPRCNLAEGMLLVAKMTIACAWNIRCTVMADDLFERSCIPCALHACPCAAARPPRAHKAALCVQIGGFQSRTCRRPAGGLPASCLRLPCCSSPTNATHPQESQAVPKSWKAPPHKSAVGVALIRGGLVAASYLD